MQYFPLTPEEKKEMQTVAGLKGDVHAHIPSACRLFEPPNIPEALDEEGLRRYFLELGALNRPMKVSLVGAGSYNHFIPAAVNAIASRGEFSTAYTPYQPEISQGTLQVIFEFQSYLAELLAMDVVNASMYDGATAAAEAALMAVRIRKIDRILISKGVHPAYRRVIETYLEGQDISFEEVPLKELRVDTEALQRSLQKETAGVIVGVPNYFGILEDLREIRGVATSSLLIAVTMEPIAFGVMTPPGELGVDIVAGEGQALGNPVNFGGPYLGIFASKREYVRNMPGRLVSQTVDTEGRTGYVLTLSTREQHIRREKATSNICTNQALCALRAAVFMSLLGKDGFYELSKLNYNRAHYFYDQLLKFPKFFHRLDSRVDSEVGSSGDFFNEFCIRVKDASLYSKLMSRGIQLGIPVEGDIYLVAVTEMATLDDLRAVIQMIEELK